MQRVYLGISVLIDTRGRGWVGLGRGDMGKMDVRKKCVYVCVRGGGGVIFT